MLKGRIRTLAVTGITVVAAGLVTLGTTAASAATTTASSPGHVTAQTAGCNSWATGSWSNNCTIYSGNASNMVEAIQTVITQVRVAYRNQLCNPKGIDGIDGPNTQAAIKCFQGAMGIGIDGIVGPITWGKLRGWLLPGPVASNGWRNYYVPDGGYAGFAETPAGNWYVWSPRSNRLVPMNLSGPN